MAIFTDWRPIATDVTFTNSLTGVTEHSLKWTQYDDDEVAIDLTSDLVTGEVVTSVTANLWRLKSTTEADDTLSNALLVGVPTVAGNVVKQRIDNLVKDRVYRLFIEFGLPGNHRTVTAVIEVVG